MYVPSLLLVLVGVVAASRTSLKYSHQTFTGVATFNDYGKQGNTVCGKMSGRQGTYGAAASDISPDIAGGRCQGSIDMGLCDGQQPKSGYAGPRCPRSNCGLCYKVTNKGGVGNSAIGGIGKHIIVEIIDSCPYTHASNFCKTRIPDEQRCQSHAKNQLDIDLSAYSALTDQEFGHGPNLDVEIQSVRCPYA